MRRTSEQERMWRLAGRYSAVGIEMVISVALTTWLGMKLDEKLGTGPWLLVVGLVIGTGAAARVVVHLLRTTKLDKL